MRCKDGKECNKIRRRNEELIMNGKKREHADIGWKNKMEGQEKEWRIRKTRRKRRRGRRSVLFVCYVCKHNQKQRTE
jgi:hypothetical protein